MNVLIAMDSFKGSLTSSEAGQAAAEGVLRACPTATVTVRPLADGGEGTVTALVDALGGRYRRVRVTGPAGYPVEAVYGILPDHSAVLEMAEAAGLVKMGEHSLNPMTTTTYGVGEMIFDAVKQGCRSFIVGIGGSATNDGGVGMLQALGYRFLNRHGFPIARGAFGLQELAGIDEGRVPGVLKECRFVLANDVTNQLCGESGCSSVYGPQKGATPSMIAQMDEWLSAYAVLTKQYHPDSDAQRPGSGAGGGIAFAFTSYLGASCQSGARLVIDRLDLDLLLEGADLVITGEGRTDFQTARGKAPGELARCAAQKGKPVVILCGSIGSSVEPLYEAGVTAIFPVVTGACSLEQAMDPVNARQNIRYTAEQVLRLYQ